MTTKDKVLGLRRRNPCATLAYIGAKVGVTRERVRQILKEDNLITNKNKITYICNNCGKEIPRPYLGSKAPMFCSQECKHAYNTITLVCDNCGKLFTRRITDCTGRGTYRNKHSYCSKKCYGNYFGVHHGFLANPQNITGWKYRNGKSKYESIINDIKYLASQGYSLYRIGVTLNIPQIYNNNIKQLLVRNNITIKRKL